MFSSEHIRVKISSIYFFGSGGGLGQLADVRQENFFNYTYRTSYNSVKNLDLKLKSTPEVTSSSGKG